MQRAPPKVILNDNYYINNSKFMSAWINTHNKIFIVSKENIILLRSLIAKELGCNSDDIGFEDDFLRCFQAETVQKFMTCNALSANKKSPEPKLPPSCQSPKTNPFIPETDLYIPSKEKIQEL